MESQGVPLNEAEKKVLSALKILLGCQAVTVLTDDTQGTVRVLSDTGTACKNKDKKDDDAANTGNAYAIQITVDIVPALTGQPATPDQVEAQRNADEAGVASIEFENLQGRALLLQGAAATQGCRLYKIGNKIYDSCA